MTATAATTTTRPELAFALELLAGDVESAAKWVTPSDQADNAGRLMRWAEAVSSGIARVAAPYWPTASVAFGRWLDARDATNDLRSTGPARDEGQPSSDRTRAEMTDADEMGELRRRLDDLEARQAESNALLVELVTYAGVSPPRYERLQRQAARLVRPNG